MNQQDAFKAHIESTAWHRVLSEAAKDDDEGASAFRMALMAAKEAWQASHAAALESAIQQLLAISARQTTLSGSVAAHDCIEAVQKLKKDGGTVK